MSILKLYDEESEKAVIGCCLVDSDVVGDVNKHISDDDFGTVNHQLIFRAILDLFQENGTLNSILVAHRLKENGNLNRVGGIDYIRDLDAVIVDIVKTDNTVYCAKQVKDYANRRKLVSMSNKMKSAAEDISKPITTVISEQADEFSNLMNGLHIPFETISAVNLIAKDIPSEKWIVPDLVPEGLTLLAGPAKVGKSFLCMNLSIAVSIGGMALSSIEIPEKRNVLYMSLEDPEQQIQSRIKTLCPDGVVGNVQYIFSENMPDNFKFDTVGLLSIDKLLSEHKSDFLIVDTWQHVKPNVKVANGSTSYDIDYQALIPLRNFAHQRGVGIIVVTHTRKSPDFDNPFNQIQGSMGMQAGCDTILMLSKGGQSGYTLHVSGRRIIQSEYALNMSSGGMWELLGDLESCNKSEIRKSIIDKLQDAGPTGMKSKEIAEALDKNSRSLNKTLRDMLKDGDITQIDRGIYCSKKY